MRLLLVEDDSMIGAALRRGLQHEGHTVDWVHDARTAEAALAAQLYELVLLDLGLPDRDGLSLLAALRRAQSPVPVIISTARDAVADRVRGLDLGADEGDAGRVAGVDEIGVFRQQAVTGMDRVGARDARDADHAGGSYAG